MTEKGDMGHLVVVLLLLITTMLLRDYYEMTIVLLQLCQVLVMCRREVWQRPEVSLEIL
jgi:hypothetical protein